MQKNLLKPNNATKDAAISAACIGLALFCCIAFLSYFSYKNILAEIQSHLISVAQTAANLTDIEAHKSLTKPEDKNNAAYVKIANNYHKILSADSELRYIYSMVYKNGNLYFIVDTSPEVLNSGADDKRISTAAVMEKYTSASPVLMRAAKEKATLAEEEPYEDDWGFLISAYAPIKDEKGKAIGMIGVDIDAQNFNKKLSLIHIGAAVGAFFTIAFSLGAFFLIKKLRTKEYEAQLANQNRTELLQNFSDKTKDIILALKNVANQTQAISKTIFDNSTEATQKTNISSKQISGAAGRMRSIAMVGGELAESMLTTQRSNHDAKAEIETILNYAKKLEASIATIASAIPQSAPQGGIGLAINSQKIALEEILQGLDKTAAALSGVAETIKVKRELVALINSDISSTSQDASFIEKTIKQIDDISLQANNNAHSLLELSTIVNQHSANLDFEVQELARKFSN